MKKNLFRALLVIAIVLFFVSPGLAKEKVIKWKVQGFVPAGMLYHDTLLRLASIGPLLTMDLGGLKLWFNVCKNLFPLINSSTEAPKALEQLTSQGHDGIKSGRGFYDYSRDFSQEDLDKAINERDQEFLNRLKNLYIE